MVKIVNRIRAACRMNDTQMMTVAALTAINLLACEVGEAKAPIWLWIGAALFWPVFVFTANLIAPLPRD